MKGIFKIAILFLVYFLTSAPGCNENGPINAKREQARLKFEQDSITSAFSSEILSFSSLKAFEENARIKFADFLDYFNIISDTSAAPAFKNQASKMISELFISDKCIFRFDGENVGKKEKLEINKLLASSDKFRKNLSNIKSDSLWIIHHLKPLNDSVFKGLIGFSTFRKIKVPNQSSASKGNIEFFVQKSNKSFGKDSYKIWIVYLGNAEIP